MSDDASFNPRHVYIVHGEYPKCIVSGFTSNVECHHILGRGGKNDRKLMSSILNCAPLWDKIHARGYIHNSHFRSFLLDLVRKAVQQKVILKEYEYTKNDLDFLRESEAIINPHPTLL